MIYFAHVTGDLVVNVSQSNDPVDPVWLSIAEADYDAVVDITDTDPRPGIGWTYDAGTGAFTPPPEPDPPAPEP